jgi:hypothetical protein
MPRWINWMTETAAAHELSSPNALSPNALSANALSPRTSEQHG